MKSGSRRDVNYYANGGTKVVFLTTAVVASDSKVGTMKTVGFQCTCRTAFWRLYNMIKPQRLKSYRGMLSFGVTFFPENMHQTLVTEAKIVMNVYERILNAYNPFLFYSLLSLLLVLQMLQ